MFNAARGAARGTIGTLGLKGESLLRIPLKDLPEQYTLAQLQQLWETDNIEDLESLLILDSCLAIPDRLVSQVGDAEITKDLSLRVANIILPDGSIILQDDAPDEHNTTSRDKAIIHVRRKANLGIPLLNTLLLGLPSSRPSSLPEPILLTLISFSSPSPYAPWTSPSLSCVASDILAKYTIQTLTLPFLSAHLLTTIIRPLFSVSKPETITSSGRKAMTPSAPQRTGTENLQRSRKPWKYEAVYSIAVFAWVVDNIPASLISQTWHLFTPPVLTLLDDPSTPIRIQGSQILSRFLPHMSATLLSQSGLGELFEDALTPTLLFLPNLTPLEESLELLPAAYNALMVLCDVRFPEPKQDVSTSTNLTVRHAEEAKAEVPDVKKERLAFLDRVMRNGIVTSYSYAQEHPSIISILLRQLGIILPKLGIHAVKHIRDILPIVTLILTNPFSPSQTPLLLSAILALRAIVLNAWPRLLTQDMYRLEVLKSLCMCWQNVLRDDGDMERKEEKIEEVKKEMRVVGEMMIKAGEAAGVGIRVEVERLVEGVPEVGGLFGM
ncbi:hypothetical protein BJ875DRAFT_462668 [Amylocarpus encephaloides]|uniref:Uncharacterized protein n=1 Tax=Amylocarpus encephaloides TaxID=45428 RepID=A0A9P8C500_9HELO|nr:hypothetical protein BJ875DRAFT_462668 [Amylocarpus encephaloides]